MRFFEEVCGPSQPNQPTGLSGVANLGAALPHVLVSLAELITETWDWAQWGRQVDQILSRVMRVPNIFVAVTDGEACLIRFVYVRDQFNRHVNRPMDGLGLTDRVYHSGKSLLLRRSHANELLAQGDLVNHGVPSKVWLGVPLRVAGTVVAVVGIQDYDSDDNLDETDQSTLLALAPVLAGLVAQGISREKDHGIAGDAGRSRSEKEALFARLGHEVRSPMSVIVGYADLLRRQLEGSEPGTTSERIFRAAQELSDASSRLIDYAAFEAEAYPVEPAPVALHGWFRGIETWLEGKAQAAGFKASVEMTAGLEESVRVDGNLLRQLLQHVLRVAFDEKGVDQVSVHLRVQPVVAQPGGRLRLSFQIEGRSGESPHPSPWTGSASLSRVVAEVDRTMGQAEVGLSIAARMVEILGGTLRISPRGELPWRAVLVMTLSSADYRRDESQNAAQETMQALRKELRERPGSVAVLSTAEHPSMDFLNPLRAATGIEPTVMRDLAELKQEMGTQNIRFVVAELSGAPGWINEIAKTISSHSANEVVPFLIAVTDDQTPKVVESLLDGGADAYIPMPLNEAALAVALADGWLEFEHRQELI